MHQLGIHTRQALRDMPASDRNNWALFFAEEPAGFAADNWRAGRSVASFLNVMFRLKPHEILKPEDIFPSLNPPEPSEPKPVDPAAFRAFSAALTGKAE